MNERIAIDPAVSNGKPVIRGTRAPVSIVVGSLAGGMTFEEIEREYDLTSADIRAALKFANELIERRSGRADCPTSTRNARRDSDARSRLR